LCNVKLYVQTQMQGSITSALKGQLADIKNKGSLSLSLSGDFDYVIPPNGKIYFADVVGYRADCVIPGEKNTVTYSATGNVYITRLA